MYNLYKYQADVMMQEQNRTSEENYTKWLLKHEDIKNKASDKLKQKVTRFLDQQQQNPSIHEDDHYKTWRYFKQHRDVEDQNKFLGFKAFQHKPSKEMNKYFNERERKQIEYLATKSKKLAEDNIIHHHHVNRSLRSQGPLHPKHAFRDRKQDDEYLQPRMRYTNITDKQKILHNSLTYDDKFHRLYQSFNSTKSKIGKTKISPTKSVNKPNFDMIQSTYSDIAKGEKFYFQAVNEEDKSAQDSSKPEEVKQKMRKTYFKAAKTMSVHGHQKAKDLMIRTQYDRHKDLRNLQNNSKHENFMKRPIL